MLSPVSRDSFAAGDDGIRHHLVARAENHQIPSDKRIRRAGLFLPVAQNVRGRSVQQGQLADGLARAKLLHRANQRVRHHDTQKQHVPPAAHQRQTNRQRHIQPVEGREEIFRQNLRGEFVAAVVGDVRLAGSRLLVRQAA